MTDVAKTYGGVYVPLHCHTEHSVLDGLSKPSELAHRAAELGMPACAITDHGSMSGCIEFYQACRKEGIKPILGMEAYTTPYGHALTEREPYDIKELRDVPGKGHQRNNYHMILLAKSYEGYKNLSLLHTISYAQGYYYKPRIDFETLAKYHDGLICQNACILGEVNHHLLHGDYQMAREHALRLQDLFGEDYYFEIMNHGLDMEIKTMPLIRELARELGVKVVATNDSHFTYGPEYGLNGDGSGDAKLDVRRRMDAKLQRTMMLLGMHKSWGDDDVSGSFFEDASSAQRHLGDDDGGDSSDPIFEMPPSLYVKSHSEMMEALCLSPEDREYALQELANTLEVAEKCNCELPIIDPTDMSQYHTPQYAIDKDIQYPDYEASGFKLREQTVAKVVSALNDDGREGSTLEELLTEHERKSLDFLMWMCEKGIEERIRPKIEAKGEPLPIEFYMENPPDGFGVVHKHNSPDELWIKAQIAEGKSVDDIIAMYRDRLDYEVSIVCRKGFLDYFSIVQQYCNYARFNGSQVGPGRGCLTGDNLILLVDGDVKRISDVHVGDVVLDEKGLPSPVVDVYDYDVDEEMIDLTIGLGEHLRLTRDHRVLTTCAGAEGDPLTSALEWRPARDLAEGDLVFFPVTAQAVGDNVGRTDLVARRVKSSAGFHHKGKVYDLKVDTPNEPSYATTACIVHNSGAGALLNYLLGITSVDPLPNKLIFERFLNPDRVGYPDIDVDFDKGFRDEQLKPYLRREYGEDNAAGVSTFIYAWGKAAIKAAARVLYNPPESVQWGSDLCELIDDHPKLDLNSELQEGVNQTLVSKMNSAPHYKKIMDLALMLQGRITGTSIHASAFILSPHPITDKMPLTVPKAERERVQKTGEKTVDYLIAYDGDVTQNALGYVKLDLLCIKDLEVLATTLRTIERVYGCKINIENVPMDDEAVFQMLGDHNVAGIFQLDGSEGMGKVMDEVKPQSIEEINAVVALFRPGPMDYIPNYVQGKWHPDTVKYLDPRLEPILKDTYGVCAYQEEAMQITQVIGGFTGGQADNYRKQAAKKHMDQLVLIKDDFINGAIDNDTVPEVAEELWEQLVKFGSYAFNRSHSAAYAYIAYRGGFLKAHFPEAFLAAMCSIKPMMKKVDKVPSYLEEARQMGVVVKPPHVNYSMESFDVPEKGVIAFGLGGIKRVGQGAAPIIEEREANGPYRDFTDFCTRVPKQVGKAPLEALIKAGALDGLGWSRMAMETSIDQIVAFRKEWFAERERKALFVDDLFGDAGGAVGESVELVAPFDAEYSERELMAKEKEQFGMYFDKDPRDFCRVSRYMVEKRMEEQSRAARKAGASDYPLFVNVAEATSLPDRTPVQFIGNVREVRAFRTKKGEMMASIFVWDNGRDESSRFGFAPTRAEVKCTIFPKKWARTTPPLPDDVVVVSGKVSVDANGEWPTAVLVDDIKCLAPDTDWIGPSAPLSKAEEYAEACAEMTARDEELGDPSSKRYLIPALTFKSATDLDAFLLDPDLRRFKGDGRVMVAVEGDVKGNRTEVVPLRQTRGMVAFAARYGGVVTKIRLPKAQRALERMRMMGQAKKDEAGAPEQEKKTSVDLA